MAPDYKTSYTLIGRALDLDDHAAWQELHDYYENFIIHLMLSMDVQTDDRDELRQTIMIRLTRALRAYNKDRGLFRSWLASLIRNEVITYLRNKKSFNNSMSSLEVVDTPEELTEESALDLYIQKEWKSHMMKIVMERVKNRFRGNAIQVYELGTKGYKPSEIAEQLNLSTTTVYTLRKRVKKFLKSQTESISSNFEL